jgi:hypothetical protein
MTDKDSEQFVVVSSTTLNRMQENISGRILSFSSEVLPVRHVLKNVNDVVQVVAEN